MTLDQYSVPGEARNVLLQGILQNKNVAKHFPKEIFGYGELVKFEGNDAPSIPINWRFAESIAALKGFEGAMLSTLVERKYGVKPQDIKVNTDHASLFFMSLYLWTLDPNGNDRYSPGSGAGKIPNTESGIAKNNQLFPSWDKFRSLGTLHRDACTNIYKTKDDRFFHLHGSLNPDHSINSLELPLDKEVSTPEESWKPYMEKMAQLDSSKMQELTADVFKQAGTICYTTEEYKQSEHGKANAHIELYDIHTVPNKAQPPCWWPDSKETSTSRPLAGLKVVDLTRIIAAPAVTRGLAEMGASIMNVMASHLPDYSQLHCDLGWGKWRAFLDLRKEEDREKLRELIMEADVVMQSYRPGVLDKYGFGQDDIIKMCEKRERGVIHVRENTYGWNGPWYYRTGWQQISDANVGVSFEYGRAMGNDEPVTPIFPNADYCTGAAGTVAIVHALIRRAEEGGSFTVDVALNYYSQWLVNSCGMYPKDVWNRVWEKNGKRVFRHYNNMTYSLPKTYKMLQDNSSDILFNPSFFEDRVARNLGVTIRSVKPIVQYPNGEIKLGYNVGCRSNGQDEPRWPKDLMVESVTASN